MERIFWQIPTIELVIRLAESQNMNRQEEVNLYAYELAARMQAPDFNQTLKDFGYKEEQEEVLTRKLVK
jgi:hypothetical protein